MREEYVSKFDVLNNSINTSNPLSIGNGNLCFTSDPTGLQTFYKQYKEIPLCTMSNKIWAGCYVENNLPLEDYKTRLGRKVSYMTQSKGNPSLYESLRKNLFKFNLFHLVFDYNGEILIKDISNISQRLSLYNGEIESRFYLVGVEVNVTSVIDQEKDILGFVIKSSLLNKGLKVKLIMENPDSNKEGYNEDTFGLTTSIQNQKITRLTPSIKYEFYYKTNGNQPTCIDNNNISFETTKESLNLAFSLTKDFNYSKSKTFPIFWDETKDLSFSNYELGKKTILSLYLIKINSTGIYPPSETGLTCNSWYGKFHLEMQPIHLLGFIRFGHYKEVYKQLNYFLDIYKSSKIRAISQGYDGVRWPKMTDPNGQDSPSNIGPLLVWQEPSLIIILEELYKVNPVLENYKKFIPLIVDIMKFIKSFVVLDNDTYYLDNPMLSMQEVYPYNEVDSPLFETELFRYALKLGLNWLERFNMPVEDDYKNIIQKLVKPRVKDNYYMPMQKGDDDYTKYNTDHPMVIGCYSLFKSDYIDNEIMTNTLDKVIECWNYDTIWGWDFGMLALCALNLGDPYKAIRFIEMAYPKNTYLKNGHNKQANRTDLPIYLPGNGMLLLFISYLNEIDF